MSEHSLTKFDRLVLSLIVATPDSSGYRLHNELMATWMGNSKIREVFGWLIGPSVGRLYVSLAKLERFDLVTSKWGEATQARGGHRPRLYRSNIGAVSSQDGAGK